MSVKVSLLFTNMLDLSDSPCFAFHVLCMANSTDLCLDLQSAKSLARIRYIKVGEGEEKPSGELALIKIKGVSLHNRVLGDDTVGLLGQMALKGFDSSQAFWLMLQYKHHETRAY